MSETSKSFALKESVKDSFAGGSFAYGEGETFDLKAALEEGNGVITTDNPQVIDVLTAHEFFKNASAPAETPATTPEPETTPTPPAPPAGEQSGGTTTTSKPTNPTGRTTA